LAGIERGVTAVLWLPFYRLIVENNSVIKLSKMNDQAVKACNRRIEKVRA